MGLLGPAESSLLGNDLVALAPTPYLVRMLQVTISQSARAFR